MILKLSVKNFYSFKEEVTIDFASNLSVIYGRNSVGKTNIIRAIQYISGLCDSNEGWARFKNGVDINSFFFNEEPSEFKFELLTNGKNYRYCLNLKEKEIVSESLYLLQDDFEEIIFIRSGNVFSTLHDDYSELSIARPKSTVSALCVHDLYEFRTDMEHLKIVREFFSGIVSNVGPQGYVDITHQHIVENATNFYNRSKNFIQVLETFVNKVDDSIVGIDIDTRVNASGEEVHFPVFKHVSDAKTYFLPLHKESSGIKKIYVMTSLIIATIQNEGVFLVDELDIHLHCDSLSEILDLFRATENAQLIFTAHSSDVINLIDESDRFLLEKRAGATVLA